MKYFLICVLIFSVGQTQAEADETSLCKFWSYPKGNVSTWNRECNRVGTYSAIETVFPHNAVEARKPQTIPNSATKILTADFPFIDRKGGRWTLGRYLAEHRVMAFMVVRDNEIAYETYQYGRSREMLFLSHSMSKTILSLLYGIAISEGLISLNTKVADVLPEFASSAWASDTVYHLLRMTPSARLVNSYVDHADNSYTNPMNNNVDPAGYLARKKGPFLDGSVFHYNGAVTAVLGYMLKARLNGRTIAQYMEEKLWTPMGGESRAVVIRDTVGNEGVQGQMAATVRDYAKLGALMVNKGRALDGTQVVPQAWIESMVKQERSKAQPTNGALYGLHVWLAQAGGGRGFFSGTHGQYIFFDPSSSTVIVQIGAAKDAEDSAGIDRIFPLRNALNDW